MSDLSVAAQAILEAVCDQTEPDCDTQHLIAAALRAAADQLAYGHGSWPGTSAVIDEDKLLAVADELEAQ